MQYKVDLRNITIDCKSLHVIEIGTYILGYAQFNLMCLQFKNTYKS